MSHDSEPHFANWLDNITDLRLIQEIEQRGYDVQDADAPPDDRAAGDPFEIIIPSGAARDNANRLLYRLQNDYSYGVSKEYTSDDIAVYNVTPAGGTRG